MIKQHTRIKMAPLAAAITAALGLTPLAYAQDDEVSSRAIEEVLVTARKRAESALEIPSSIQALSGDDLKEMGARGMADEGGREAHGGAHHRRVSLGAPLRLAVWAPLPKVLRAPDDLARATCAADFCASALGLTISAATAL